MRASSEKARKSARFGLQNRAWERPGEPKSRPGGPVRAAKREKIVRSPTFFFCGVERASQSEKVRHKSGPRRRSLRKPPKTRSVLPIEMYVCTRVLPSISIDNGILRHCGLVAFAKSSDYFNGHGWATMASACIAIWLHLQKLWIGFDGFG